MQTVVQLLLQMKSALKCAYLSERDFNLNIMETTNEQDQKEGTQTWTATVDEEGVLTLPDEVWKSLGWQHEDVVEWIEQEDGTFLLVKVDDSNGSDQASNDAGND